MIMNFKWFVRDLIDEAVAQSVALEKKTEKRRITAEGHSGMDKDADLIEESTIHPTADDDDDQSGIVDKGQQLNESTDKPDADFNLQSFSILVPFLGFQSLDIQSAPACSISWRSR